jgi:mono/diheme cytochrome c family protein
MVTSEFSRTILGSKMPLPRNVVTLIWHSLFSSLLILFVVAPYSSKAEAQETTFREIQAFLKDQCLDCHAAGDPAGGLDIDAMTEGLNFDHHFETLVRMVDRVEAKEMPPKDASQPEDGRREQFVSGLGQQLREYQLKKFAEYGRVQGRRLTNIQLERTLQDLLGIDIPLSTLMSEEQRTAGFATVASGQSMSHFQLEEHLKVVDAALTEAFRRVLSSPDEFEVEFDSLGVARKDPNKRCREPEMIDNLAVVWASRLIFYGRLPVTAAKQDGWYEFKVKVSGRNKPEAKGVWCTVRSGPCISSAPLLSWVGAFEANEEPKEWTFVAWLPKGHMLEIRPGDTTLKMANFQGGQVGAGEGEPQNVAGINLHALTMRRIHTGPDNAIIRKMLFGSLELEVSSQGVPGGKGRTGEISSVQAELKSTQPEADLQRLIHLFAQRAFRSPVPQEVSQPFVDIAIDNYKQGQSLLSSLRTGYRSILCSPRFLYFHEAAGVLDDYALANRLSYMLWNSMPDEELMDAARSGRLSDKEGLKQQVERMLKAKRGTNFVRDLAYEWLDLRLIDFTEPDRRLYPTFDIIVQQSMLEETYRCLQEMLERNASVTELIDSDYTYVDSRLARFYGIENIDGDEIRRVRLREADHRGGVLTHGSILKVTANGTTTSPVIRGVWISERLMGEHIPPPPQGVPAIEPDIRGATSIRELLAKHRNSEACAVCHVKIDPPGFALENYDPAGRYRDVYASVDKKKGSGIKVDSSYDTAEGKHFASVDEFRGILCSKPEKLAKNVAEKLIIIATGSLPTYTDRDEIDEILSASSRDDYGLRSILHAVVNSDIFRSK